MAESCCKKNDIDLRKITQDFFPAAFYHQSGEKLQNG